MPLWEQNPKDRVNTPGNKRAQDPGPPKGTANKEEPEAHLCLTGKQSADHPGPETETRASQNRWKITGWGFKTESGSTEHTAEDLQSRFDLSRNNHVPIGERTLSHSQYELTSADTW